MRTSAVRELMVTGDEGKRQANRFYGVAEVRRPHTALAR